MWKAEERIRMMYRASSSQTNISLKVDPKDHKKTSADIDLNLVNRMIGGTTHSVN